MRTTTRIMALAMAVLAMMIAPFTDPASAVPAPTPTPTPTPTPELTPEPVVPERPPVLVPDTIDVEAILKLQQFDRGTGTTLSAPMRNLSGNLSMVLTFGGAVDPSIVSEIVVEYNPVIYRGAVPDSRAVDVLIPNCDVKEIKATYKLVNGGTRVDVLPVQGGACAAAAATPLGTGGGTGELAFTGTEMTAMLAAVGALLISSGRIMVLKAREQD